MSKEPRCTCVDCGISLGINEPGDVSPVTCRHCTERLRPAELCARCRGIIAVGEAYLRDDWLGPQCSRCADARLRQKTIDAEEEYNAVAASTDEDDMEERDHLYERTDDFRRLRSAMKKHRWQQCLSIAKGLGLDVEVAR